MTEIQKAYDPRAVEDKWYQFWLDQNCFVAEPARVSDKRPAYSIVIPPPNVTGVLHMGHVLNNTIQDILARKARMDGKEVLWLPGTDHAGIATQVQVEKALQKEGKTKHDLGREAFLERVWAWKHKHGGIIIQQLKKLGCSCDWTRERFTLDPDYSRCVQKVFAELYKKGLIYRGKRMVNWDPAARTALSDEEVEMIETRGHLWHLKYPLLDASGRPLPERFVVVATTRPETMLGDEAVAVHPHDPRYADLIGSRCLLPLQDKPIPIIADELVDPKFGTGCVKVTPAHDPADYEMALRHHLPLTVVIGPDGRMTPAAGARFAGLDRMEARKAVVAELEQRGLLLKVEDYVHNVGYSQRSHVPIEPYLSEQWFLKYPSVEASIRAVEEGRIAFHPERWIKTYTHWMRNLKDWCISRQLWWGHRVPVWNGSLHTTERAVWSAIHQAWEQIEAQHPGRLAKETAVLRLNGSPTVLSPQSIASGLAAAPDQPAELELALCCSWDALGEAVAALLQLERDPDVLDTWFSSWLWPFATMGWTGDPEQDAQNATLRTFYPTTDLVTGPDIIFFWVARMIMAGYEFMGERPFQNIYFTGIIRDKLGRKMSKTLGNSPDPLELIAKYGADALRFGTMRSAPLGQDVLFDEKDVELGRNFCNKLWNACRFRQLQGGVVQGEINPLLLTGDDKWILLKLDAAIREISDALAGYNFNTAIQTLYRFFWSEFCDWYLEASKATLNRPAPDAHHPSPPNPTEPSQVSATDPTAEAHRANTLAVMDFVLSHALRLFHPFLPFITEELWHALGYDRDMPPDQGGQTIMTAPWPKPLSEDEKAHLGLEARDAEFTEQKYELVRQGRNLRRIGNIPAGRKVRFILKPRHELCPHDLEVVRLLLQADAVELDGGFAPRKGTPMARTPLGDLFLPLEGLVDFAAEAARLRKELEKARAEIARLDQKLADPNFTQKAPAHVLEEHRQRLAEWQAKRDHLIEALNVFES